MTNDERLEAAITALIVKNTNEIRQRLSNVEHELDFAKAVISQNMNRVIYCGWQFVYDSPSAQYYIAKETTGARIEKDHQIMWFDTLFEAYEELRAQGKLK